MPDRAARLARLGTRLVSALAGLLMLALLAFGGFALWQDAALRRGAFVGAELLQYKPAAPAADNPTLAGLQTVNPDVCGWLTVDGTGIVHIAPTFGADDDRVGKQAGIVPMYVVDRAGKNQPMVDRRGRLFRIEDMTPTSLRNTSMRNATANGPAVS